MRRACDFTVIVMCECSQIVVHEFLKRGFNAWSIDVQPSYGKHPERHIQGDCFQVFEDVFGGVADIVIAHPPCTYLSNAGVRWLKGNDTRLSDMWNGLAFFERCLALPCSHLAVENPIGLTSRFLSKPTQIIQPYYFGEEYSKRTGLWLKGLPKLVPTKVVGRGEVYVSPKGRVLPKWYADAYRLPPQERQNVRSKTFTGIASAMATQWGDYLLGDDIRAFDEIHVQGRLFDVW